MHIESTHTVVEFFEVSHLEGKILVIQSGGFGSN